MLVVLVHVGVPGCLATLRPGWAAAGDVTAVDSWPLSVTPSRYVGTMNANSSSSLPIGTNLRSNGRTQVTEPEQGGIEVLLDAAGIGFVVIHEGPGTSCHTCPQGLDLAA